jgi:hypothetical protein
MPKFLSRCALNARTMKARRILVELVVLLLGSTVVGILVGTLQHYAVFVHFHEFGKGALELAFFEGSIVGVMFAVPTGLIVYYVVLSRRVTRKQVSVIVVGSLVGGVGAGVLVGIPSVLVTPIVTIGIARYLREVGSPQIEMPPSRF